MSSIRRIIANRLNAAHSTGPRTEAGKRRSSQNALRHGCRSRKPFPLPEITPDPEFHSLLQSFSDELQPRTPAEHACVYRLVAAKYRLRILRAQETRLWNEAMAAQPPGLDPLGRKADAFISLANTRAFKAISRYEVAQALALDRALHDLRTLRRTENKNCTIKPNLSFPNDAEPGKIAVNSCASAAQSLIKHHPEIPNAKPDPAMVNPEVARSHRAQPPHRCTSGKARRRIIGSSICRHPPPDLDWGLCLVYAGPLR